jgi:lipopolysaccharide biosynthesis protein
VICGGSELDEVHVRWFRGKQEEQEAMRHVYKCQHGHRCEGAEEDVERLTALVETQHGTALVLVRQRDEAEAQVEHLKANNRYQAGYAAGEKSVQAEVERLREALAEIIVLEGTPATEVLRIARAALRREP